MMGIVEDWKRANDPGKWPRSLGPVVELRESEPGRYDAPDPRDWLFELDGLVELYARELHVEDQWRQIFAYGETLHPALNFKVDAEFCREMIASFEYLREKYGYYPPICIEHRFELHLDQLGQMRRLPPETIDSIEEWSEADAEVIDAVCDEIGRVSDGTIWGFINAIEERDGGLWVRPIYKKAADTMRRLGLLDYVSPSFFPEAHDPHNGGRTLRYLLRELTHCKVPHQKNLKTPLNNAVIGLSEHGFNAYEGTEDMEKLLQTIIAMLEALPEQVAEAVAGGGNDGDESDEPTEAMDDDEGAVENSAVLAELQKLRVDNAVAREIPAIMQRTGADESAAEKIARAKIANPGAHEIYLGLIDQAGAGATTPITGRNGAPAAPVNNSAGLDQAEKRKLLVDCATRAKAAGVERANFWRRVGELSEGKLGYDDLESDIIDHVYKG